MFKNCGGGNPKKMFCLIAMGLGLVIFLSMFCSAQFLLFLAAVTLVVFGAALLFFIK